MTMSIISKVLGDKQQYRQYKARVAQLPANYRDAVEALERYLMLSRSWSAAGLMSMLEDLLDLFEQSAASGTSIRGIVGDDPVEFAETFLQTYTDGDWLTKERQRLAEAIAQAERGEQGH
jgi:DNA-binding ferritin-like protein (Dps family)